MLRWLPFAIALSGLGAFAPANGTSAPPSETLAGSSCSEDCTRKASDCIDACEEKFKNDDKGRVTCKFECANTRQKCEKDCGG
jgi:hypothetical protein